MLPGLFPVRARDLGVLTGVVAVASESPVLSRPQFTATETCAATLRAVSKPRPVPRSKRTSMISSPMSRTSTSGGAPTRKTGGSIATLKGGYWGPVRNRCRPMTVDHNEWHSGYQIGFRCCAAGQDQSPAQGASVEPEEQRAEALLDESQVSG